MTIKMRPQRPTAPTPEDFVAGATAVTPDPATAAQADLPWLNAKVRDDLRVQLNARLPERLIVQRDWLAHRLGLKKQDVLEIALREWVAARLHDLGLQD